MLYGYGLGLLPEKKDDRDLLFYNSPIPTQKILEEVDLRKLQTPVINQGKYGTCTGCALASLRGFLENKHSYCVDGVIKEEHLNLFEKFLKFLEIRDDSYYKNYSPMFIYYEIRKKEGNLDYDSGGTIRTGMKVLRAIGAPPERVWPYTSRNLLLEPCREAYKLANKNQILSYYRIQIDSHKIKNMKIALSNGLVVVGGITLFDGIYKPKKGLIEYPTHKESKLGDHALVFCGYSNETKTFIVKNSWGIEYGENGYIYLPFDYVDDYATDLWVADEWE